MTASFRAAPPTAEDIRGMLRRALVLCEDLHCPDDIVSTLHRCGLSFGEVGSLALSQAIERERIRRGDTFNKLGDAADRAIARIGADIGENG